MCACIVASATVLPWTKSSAASPARHCGCRHQHRNCQSVIVLAPYQHSRLIKIIDLVSSMNRFKKLLTYSFPSLLCMLVLHFTAYSLLSQTDIRTLIICCDSLFILSSLSLHMFWSRRLWCSVCRTVLLQLADQSAAYAIYSTTIHIYIHIHMYF